MGKGFRTEPLLLWLVIRTQADEVCSKLRKIFAPERCAGPGAFLQATRACADKGFQEEQKVLILLRQARWMSQR